MNLGFYSRFGHLYIRVIKQLLVTIWHDIQKFKVILIGYTRLWF